MLQYYNTFVYISKVNIQKKLKKIKKEEENIKENNKNDNKEARYAV